MVAKYWKNGISITLGPGNRPSEAYSIKVINDDVFVAGYEDKETTIPGNDAVYWRNGKPYILTPDNDGMAYDIVVKNK